MHTDRATPEPITSVWNLQTELIAAGAKLDVTPDVTLPKVTVQDFGKCFEVLRPQLIAQMRKAPIPEMIWRRRNERGASDVVLGLAGVMQEEPKADERLMFGGARTAKDAKTPDPLKTAHACPGYAMATGVMLGMIATLLLRGSLRPTASPTIVTLVT